MKPKRSLEQLQQIELAIKNKYGDETINDPRQFWNKEKEEDFKKQIKDNEQKCLLREENEVKIEKDGFLISRRLLTIKNSEGCLVCNKYFTNNTDNIYLLKFKCCQMCYINFVEGREEKWKEKLDIIIINQNNTLER